MRAVWLNGSIVDPSDASVGIDCAAVRFGDGLFETMYAKAGRIALLDAHLARIHRSAAALHLHIAHREHLKEAVVATVGACGAAHQRVRLSAAPDLVLVEATKIAQVPDAPAVARASIVENSWFPGRSIAEHKTLSYGSYRVARRAAERAGAKIALLADHNGRLGEADVGNLFAVVEDELFTPPVDGLLPGIARAVLLDAGLASEAHLTPQTLEVATELFMTNAVSGVTTLTDIAGAAWSRETPGPGARRAHRTLVERP